MTSSQSGLLAMVGCASVWGLSGIYYKALLHVDAFQVIAHRTLWSMVFFGLILFFQGRLKPVLEHCRERSVIGLLITSAAMISVNWSLFVISIHNGWALEASFGYYIFPLMAVVLGMFLLGESLSGLQITAVLIACVAVLLLAYGLGAVPWVSLLLAATFSAYGLIKRRVEIGPVASVFLEVLLVAPIALGFVVWMHGNGEGAFGSDLWTSLLLIGSGPLTAIPLLFFSYATRRINFATVGLVQYLNPSLQFLVAVFLFGEIFTPWHGIALPMIWLALSLYTIAGFRALRKKPAPSR